MNGVNPGLFRKLQLIGHVYRDLDGGVVFSLFAKRDPLQIRSRRVIIAS
jgi:hypothetical protein